MAKTSSNVVRLADASRDPALRILIECRDQLQTSLGQWLQDLGPTIAEELFSLADSTRDTRKQRSYLDLRKQVEGSWQPAVQAFRRTFSTDRTPSSVSLEIPDFEGLKLIDDEELSESIVIRELAARIGETCDQELYALDRRVALILNDEDAEDIEHPLQPAAICRALSDTCAALTDSAELRTVLLRRLERHLHTALPEMYASVNAYLIELGLLPDLKRGYRRAPAKATTADGQTMPAQTVLLAPSLPAGTSIPAAATAEFAEMAKSSPGNPGDFLYALQHMVSARFGHQTPVLADIPMPAALTGELPASSASPADAAAALSSVFLASLEQLRSDEGATVNQIHRIRESEAARQVGHVEAVTIDIVAMLFDFIFEDKKVPEAVKSLVGRLQIPILKLAMEDSSFFSNRNHPARRFLDEISEIAIRWGGDVDTEDPFYCILARLVTCIQDHMESDVDIFTRVLKELEEFVDKEAFVEDKAAEAAAEIAARHEREATAWERAHASVKELATQHDLPQIVRSFLHEHWLYVLQKVAIEHDSESGAWQDAMQLIGDLSSSLEPVKSPDERASLLRALPGLLGRINRGLDLVEADKNERRPFFDQLVIHHAAAMKGERHTEPGHEAPPKHFAATRIAQELDTNTPAGDLLVMRTLEDGVEIEEITLVGGKPGWTPDERDISRRVAELKRGDWVEFRPEGGEATRERLTWISPQGRVLLFSNHRSAKAISVAPEALARLVKNGLAAFVEEDSLFERAMSGVIENMAATTA